MTTFNKIKHTIYGASLALAAYAVISASILEHNSRDYIRNLSPLGQAWYYARIAHHKVNHLINNHGGQPASRLQANPELDDAIAEARQADDNLSELTEGRATK